MAQWMQTLQELKAFLGKTGRPKRKSSDFTTSCDRCNDAKYQGCNLNIRNPCARCETDGIRCTYLRSRAPPTTTGGSSMTTPRTTRARTSSGGGNRSHSQPTIPPKHQKKRPKSR